MALTPIIITCVILAAYILVLYHITGKNRDAEKLIWAFGFVAVAGFVYHMILFCAVTRDGFMQFESGMARFLFSVQYSLEMFIANTIIFKGEVMSAMKQEPLLFYFYLPIYGMALLTSGFAIFHFLSRRLHNWMWLTFHKRYASSTNTHIFVGINEPSCCLAKAIADSGSKDMILFIDIPDQQDNPQGISVWDIIARFFKDSKDVEKLNDYVVLKSGKGLNKIVPWLKRKENKLYILSNCQETNLAILEELWENKTAFNCTVYCHAKKEGLVNRYDSIADVKDRIRFVDSSYLAVEYLKKHNTGELLPVNFVDIAKEEGKRNLGYVTSSFNCAVIGFGETGKEALKFLYEFGAFPDINNDKAPFKCHVFDKNIDKEMGEFGMDLRDLHSPEVSESEFVLHSCEVGSIEFRTKMMELVNDLNYVVVCLGDDDTNLNIALNIAEYAVLNGRDTGKNFCIAVKQTQLNNLNQETLDNANKTYKNSLHPFGMQDTIWKVEIIDNKQLDDAARRFFESYTALSEAINKKLYPDYPVDTWKQRDEKSCSEAYDYGVRCDAKRKIAQDYSNCLHVMTKRILCKSSGVSPDMILPVNEGEKGTLHCTSEVEILEHLAVCEHLRWEASHLMLGYRPTIGRKENERKLHNCIKSYSQLDEATKHYDWLVVKNSIGETNQKSQSEIKEEYIPKPIDTSDIVLPKQLDGLIEQMSENVHEVWAESRMSQGWTYGKERNDALKQHPCLVPYKDLPEVEKAYDRDTALGTLKLIIKLGFRITPKIRTCIRKKS